MADAAVFPFVFLGTVRTCFCITCRAFRKFLLGHPFAFVGTAVKTPRMAVEAMTHAIPALVHREHFLAWSHRPVSRRIATWNGRLFNRRWHRFHRFLLLFLPFALVAEGGSGSASLLGHFFGVCG